MNYWLYFTTITCRYPFKQNTYTVYFILNKNLNKYGHFFLRTITQYILKYANYSYKLGD